jgi:hypothetical protein
MAHLSGWQHSFIREISKSIGRSCWLYITLSAVVDIHHILTIVMNDVMHAGNPRPAHLSLSHLLSYLATKRLSDKGPALPLQPDFI